MNRVPKLSLERDVLTEFVESGLGSAEAFAGELGIPPERVAYWLALAEIKRQRHIEVRSWDRD